MPLHFLTYILFWLFCCCWASLPSSSPYNKVTKRLITLNNAFSALSCIYKVLLNTCSPLNIEGHTEHRVLSPGRRKWASARYKCMSTGTERRHGCDCWWSVSLKFRQTAWLKTWQSNVWKHGLHPVDWVNQTCSDGSDVSVGERRGGGRFCFSTVRDSWAKCECAPKLLISDSKTWNFAEWFLELFLLWIKVCTKHTQQETHWHILGALIIISYADDRLTNQTKTNTRFHTECFQPMSPPAALKMFYQRLFFVFTKFCSGSNMKGWVCALSFGFKCVSVACVCVCVTWHNTVHSRSLIFKLLVQFSFDRHWYLVYQKGAWWLDKASADHESFEFELLLEAILFHFGTFFKECLDNNSQSQSFLFLK